MKRELSKEQVQAILDYLNEMAPDTFNESNIRDWKFLDVKYDSKSNSYKIYFDNDYAEDSVSVKSDYEPFDENYEEGDLPNLDWIGDVGTIIDEWIENGGESDEEE